MQKKVNTVSSKITILVALIFMAFELSGCATVGSVIPEEKQILFNADGTGEGKFKSGQLSLDYSYKPIGKNMSFSGVITSVWDYDSITVRLLFVDGSGTVLQQKIVYFSTSGFRIDPSSSHTFATFKTVLSVPPGTVGISYRMTGDIRQDWSR